MNNFSKIIGRVIVLSLFLFSITSCISLIRTIGGFKNPKVETKSSIKSFISNTIFEDKNLYFNKPLDSVKLKKIVLSSMNGEIIIFDQDGNRKCYNGNEKCSSIQIRQIEGDFNNYIGECENIKNDFTLVYNNINVLLKSLSTSDENSIKLIDLPKSDFYIVYYWSIFSGSKKDIINNFLWFKKSLEKWGENIHIITVNCDLREDWGLVKGKKWKIKLKKQEGRMYELIFGNIPYIRN